MTKEYQEAERRLHEQAVPMSDAAFLARIARLEAALKRFGYATNKDGWHINSCEGDCDTGGKWYAADCRQARAALEDKD